MTKPLNEPAFPIITWQYPQGLVGQQIQKGLTLRDYFAIHAPTEEVTKNHPECNAANYYETIIKQRYIYADTMLLERQKGEYDTL